MKYYCLTRKSYTSNYEYETELSYEIADGSIFMGVVVEASDSTTYLVSFDFTESSNLKASINYISDTGFYSGEGYFNKSTFNQNNTTITNFTPDDMFSAAVADELSGVMGTLIWRILYDVEYILTSKNSGITLSDLGFTNFY